MQNTTQLTMLNGAPNRRGKRSVKTSVLRWKAETLKVCLLLVWRVCDQAFGRYMAAEGWWKMVTWSLWKLKICIQTHVETFTDSKNAILFDLQREISKLSRKKSFQNSGVTRRLWTLGRLELTLVVNIHPSNWTCINTVKQNRSACN